MRQEKIVSQETILKNEKIGISVLIISCQEPDDAYLIGKKKVGKK